MQAEAPIRVAVSRVTPLTNDFAADLKKAEALAKWMDGQFTVAGIPVGFDAIIGLLPVAGDAVSFVIGLYPVLIARKHKIGGAVLVTRMLANLGVDFLAGSVPVVGDALDVFVRANLKNVALLKKAATRAGRIGSRLGE